MVAKQLSDSLIAGIVLRRAIVASPAGFAWYLAATVLFVLLQALSVQLIAWGAHTLSSSPSTEEWWTFSGGPLLAWQVFLLAWASVLVGAAGALVLCRMLLRRWAAGAFRQWLVSMPGPDSHLNYPTSAAEAALRYLVVLGRALPSLCASICVLVIVSSELPLLVVIAFVLLSAWVPLFWWLAKRGRQAALVRTQVRADLYRSRQLTATDAAPTYVEAGFDASSQAKIFVRAWRLSDESAGASAVIVSVIAVSLLWVAMNSNAESEDTLVRLLYLFALFRVLAQGAVDLSAALVKGARFLDRLRVFVNPTVEGSLLPIDGQGISNE